MTSVFCSIAYNNTISTHNYILLFWKENKLTKVYLFLLLDDIVSFLTIVWRFFFTGGSKQHIWLIAVNSFLYLLHLMKILHFYSISVIDNIVLPPSFYTS